METPRKPNDKRETQFKIAAGQLSASPSMEANVQKACAQIDEAASLGAKLITFPEIGFETFFPQCRADASCFASAETIPGPLSDLLCKKARENNIVVIASYMEEGWPGEYFDSAVCVDSDGTLLGIVRMVHTYEGVGFNEKYYYGPGNTYYPVFETTAGNIGVAICYDSWFPEAIRTMALRGADIIAVPTVEAFVPTLPPTDHIHGTMYEMLTSMYKANCVQNNLFCLMSNRVGKEGDMTFMGASFVCDPWGHVIARANAETDEVLVCEIDLDEAIKARQAWPMLRDRRPDTYGLVLSNWSSPPYYNYASGKVRISDPAEPWRARVDGGSQRVGVRQEA